MRNLSTDRHTVTALRREFAISAVVRIEAFAVDLRHGSIDRRFRFGRLRWYRPFRRLRWCRWCRWCRWIEHRRKRFRLHGEEPLGAVLLDRIQILVIADIVDRVNPQTEHRLIPRAPAGGVTAKEYLHIVRTVDTLRSLRGGEQFAVVFLLHALAPGHQYCCHIIDIRFFDVREVRLRVVLKLRGRKTEHPRHFNNLELPGLQELSFV